MSPRSTITAPMPSMCPILLASWRHQSAKTKGRCPPPPTSRTRHWIPMQGGCRAKGRALQGYLAHKTQRPPRTLETMPRAPRWSRGGGAVSYERGTLFPKHQTPIKRPQTSIPSPLAPGMLLILGATTASHMFVLTSCLKSSFSEPDQSTNYNQALWSWPELHPLTKPSCFPSMDVSRLTAASTHHLLSRRCVCRDLKGPSPLTSLTRFFWQAPAESVSAVKAENLRKTTSQKCVVVTRRARI